MHALIVEDDPDMVSLLKAGLDSVPYEVSTSRTAEQALALIKQHAFDVVLLDLELPGRDGLTVLRQLRQRRAHVPVIIITGGRTAIDDRVKGLDAGADDYLIKPFPLPELLARIRAVTRRVQDAAASDIRVGDLEIHVARRAVLRGGQEIELTPREFELLEFLARHAGEIITRERISTDVWRQAQRATPMDNVIDVHISHLRQKIDGGHDQKLLHTVWGTGFVLKA
jgi:two-component system copper resistance phosphate regulon response regulator CusR